jgi:amino acid adenylation domain-containing protein
LTGIGAVEREQVLEWNRTEREYERGMSVAQVFEEQAKHGPDRVAVVCGERSLTYAALNRQANQLAHYLKKRGVGPEKLVGICLENSAGMMVALLGVLKAGGVYVPLDIRLPKERIFSLVNENGISVLITHRRKTGDFLPPGTVIVDIEADGQSLGHESEEDPEHNLQPENLAYMLFTSGSTGQPKGVAVEHRQLQNYLAAAMERLDLQSIKSFVLVQPLSVDAAVTTIFPPLLSGGALHIISQEMSLDAEALAEYFKRNNAEYFKCAPAHLMALQAAGGETLLPSRCLVLGGEAARWDWLARIRRKAPGSCTFFNQYGPTETTVGALVHQIERHTEQQSPITLLGRPLANTRAYILDELGVAAPLGVPGELYIGGANVARGYWNIPDLTAERFIPDAFGPDPSQRLYRTGDLCRYLPTGDLEYLGRLDGQIKIRGYRVEPREIETRLARHESVEQCAVVMRENPQNQKLLVAYVVRRPGAAPRAEHLHGYLQEYLPEYMVPNHFVWLQELPLSRHGKLEVSRLPQPDAEQGQVEREFEEPRTAFEKVLTEIWAEVLSVQRVGLRDNFFELGGHSLLATQVISRIRRIFQIKVPLRLLFENPVLIDLAAAILKDREKQLQSHAELLIKLVGLSDEETEMLLAADLGVEQKGPKNG